MKVFSWQIFLYLIQFRFSLDRHTDLDRIFNIHSGNGSIYTSKMLDREISQWHNLSVIAAEISKLIAIDASVFFMFA